MFCDKHIDTRMYIKSTQAAQCQHMTHWQFHLFCETCSNDRKICQECGERVLKTPPESQAEKEK